MDQGNYVDNGKRGRLFFIALLIAVSIFVLRSSEIVDIKRYLHLVGLSVGYFSFIYLALVWAFKFQVNKRSLIIVIPQSAIFVTTQVLFIYLFFFRNFERVYELLLLVVLLGFIFVSSYISFLMSNVFNVSIYKQIPLLQVAKTTSYIVTLLVIYFSTYVLIAFNVDIFLTIITISMLYTLNVFIHLVLIGHDINTIRSSIAPIVIAMVTSVVPAMFLGSRNEVSALLPVSVAFVLLGLEMARNKGENRNILYAQYFIVLLGAFVINLVFNV